MLEFGYNNLVTPNTPTVGQPYNAYTYTNFSWVGKHQKFDESSFVLNPIQMGARVYIPSIGRFTSVDPIDGGTANAYVYPGDTVNSFDLTGTKAQRGWNSKKQTAFSPDKEKRIQDLANKKGRTSQETQELKGLTKERKGKKVTQGKGAKTRPSRQTKDDTVVIPIAGLLYKRIATYGAVVGAVVIVGAGVVLLPEVTTPALAAGGKLYAH